MRGRTGKRKVLEIIFHVLYRVYSQNAKQWFEYRRACSTNLLLSPAFVWGVVMAAKCNSGTNKVATGYVSFLVFNFSNCS